MAWTKLSQEEILNRVNIALGENINYSEESKLGIPASYLDNRVFNQDASFIKDAPYIATLVKNPNHIGCHTLNQSESYFSGTQAIERELIDICASDILKGERGTFDGYVASGGTEANLQAIWIYRNMYMTDFAAKSEEICILCSEDSHYSMHKAANVLSIDVVTTVVDDEKRFPTEKSIDDAVSTAMLAGKKYFIVVCNMMTTMFGSVDEVVHYTSVLKEKQVEFRVHIDGAYGGFYYPFANEDTEMNFTNPDITSFTLDAHKMAQAPYGTGIFLIRKDYMQHALTKEASYVKGDDYTLIGSRSGANAVAVWMILSKTGPHGWYEKILVLQNRTNWFCKQLASEGIRYYRHPSSNIVTIDAKQVRVEVAEQFGLVPDSHHEPKWFKVVIMDHVTIEKLSPLFEALMEGES